MAGRERKWRLEDVVDFEALLVGGVDDLGLSEPDRAAVRAGSRGIGRDAAKRRRGLRAWLEERRSERGAGHRAVEGARLAGIILGVLAFVLGIGLVRGLLLEFEGGSRMFNIWMFLGVAVGLQWLVLSASAAGYLLVRRKSGALSLGARLTGFFVRRLSGRLEGGLWKSLLGRGRGYHSVFGWRLARMAQGVGVIFNLGLLAGFFGCLWVLKVDLFWESTLFKIETIQCFGQWVALPWSWSSWGVLPALEDQQFDLLHKRFVIDGAVGWPFLFMVIVVWGLAPRLLLWLVCWFNGRRALATLGFQEPRHRELWRALTGVRSEVVTEGPADGVILLDVGGSGVRTEALREFLLRRLRVNPEGRFEAAVLDAGREEEAWAAIRKAPLGVVFLVEGWALSPKQMDVLYRRVRERSAERPLRFLVLGEVEDGWPGPPREEEAAQWIAYVDGLRDPGAEVVLYEELEPVEEG